MAKQLDRWYCTFTDSDGKTLPIITLQPPKVGQATAGQSALKQAALLNADVTLKLSARLYDK